MTVAKSAKILIYIYYKLPGDTNFQRTETVGQAHNTSPHQQITPQHQLYTDSKKNPQDMHQKINLMYL